MIPVVPTSGVMDAVPLSQRDIYDLRYSGDGYDQRSAVPVLTAERSALHAATRRVLAAVPDLRVLTLLDFGYGTGRVTNEFVLNYPVLFGADAPELHVIAYDVSSVGLLRGARALERHSDLRRGELAFDRHAGAGYVAGALRGRVGGIATTLTLVHACEAVTADDADETQQFERLVKEATDGDLCLMTTSWYSALGHVPGTQRRRRFFEALGRVTHPVGELLLAVSATGDLVEEQQEWADRLAAGETGGFPVERTGDTVYLTELGQLNFWHLFGTELEDDLEATLTADQTCWVEALRMPDAEFETVAEEQANHRRAEAFNAARAQGKWTAEDYAQVHTVAAVRSGTGRPSPVGGQAG